MFDDLLPNKPERPDFSDTNRFADIQIYCPNCAHSVPDDLYEKNGFKCTIGAGISCAWNNKEPFNKYIPKRG